MTASFRYVFMTELTAVLAVYGMRMTEANYITVKVLQYIILGRNH